MRKNNIHIVFFLFFLLSFVSCFKPGSVLNKEKMTAILTEMHKTEGTLQAEGYDYNNPEEKKKYYDAILKKYKIKQADFDSSLVWYAKHPKEFGLVYTDVLARLDTLNAQVQRGKFHPNEGGNGMQEINIWNLRTNYKLTKDSARTKIDFEIPGFNNLMVGDTYILSFLRRVAPIDSSLNPHIVLRINYLNGKKDSIYTRSYNDSLLRRYTLMFKARDTLKIESISGSLLGNDSSKGKMSAFLDSIKLIRKFNVYNQIKIRKRLEKLDTTRLKKVLEKK